MPMYPYAESKRTAKELKFFDGKHILALGLMAYLLQKQTIIPVPRVINLGL